MHFRSAYPEMPMPAPKAKSKKSKSERRADKTSEQIIDFGDELAMIFSPMGTAYSSPPQTRQKPPKEKKPKSQTKEKQWVALY